MVQKLTHGSIVAVATMLPALTMVSLIMYQANEHSKGDALVAAQVAQKQVDHLLTDATKNTDEALSLVGKRCNDILRELAQIANLSLYVRSMVLVHDGNMYCSSVVGSAEMPVSTLIPRIQPGLHIFPIFGTLLVPAHPALLLVRGIAEGRGVIATIDGQHLQNIREAEMDEGQLHVQILDTELQRLLPGGEPYRPEHHTLWDISGVAKSRAFPVEVHVNASPSLVANYRRDLWENYAPLQLLLGVLTGYLADVLCRRRFSLRGDIQRGIGNDEFYMMYQPMINLNSGKFGGVEALVRWKRPGQENITPDVFIPFAEDNGLITDLTCHILDLIANDLPRLHLSSEEHLGINISSSHFARRQFLNDIQQFLKRLAPSHPVIVLELTEREVLPNDEAVQYNLQQVRDSGIRLALDDFGTGHSSASYLAQFDADYIKIDRSYIKSIGKDSVNAVVLESIIRLGHTLNLEIDRRGSRNRSTCCIFT